MRISFHKNEIAMAGYYFMRLFEGLFYYIASVADAIQYAIYLAICFRNASCISHISRSTSKTHKIKTYNCVNITVLNWISTTLMSRKVSNYLCAPNHKSTYVSAHNVLENKKFPSHNYVTQTKNKYP